MKKVSKFNIAVILIMILESIALSGIILYLASSYSQSGTSGDGSVLSYDYSENGKYVLYIGLNDKDTCSQIISAEEAKEIVKMKC